MKPPVSAPDASTEKCAPGLETSPVAAYRWPPSGVSVIRAMSGGALADGHATTGTLFGVSVPVAGSTSNCTMTAAPVSSVAATYRLVPAGVIATNPRCAASGSAVGVTAPSVPSARIGRDCTVDGNSVA